MEAGSVVCGAICPSRTEERVGQPWVQRSFMSADLAGKIGWRQVNQSGSQGLRVVWACPECALELGVIAKLEGGYRSALVILTNHEGIMSTLAFSETRWPERATVGKGWNMSATGLLGRLAKLALIACKKEPMRNGEGELKRNKAGKLRERVMGYRITRAGQQALKVGRYDVPKEVQKERAARWADRQNFVLTGEKGA